MIELAVVVMLALIITAFSIPYVLNIKNSQGILSDARSISAALNLARMRAAADFSHGRVYMDLAGNTYHLEVWNKAGGCWQTDGDANACTIATSPVTTLATGDTFGFGTIATGPAAAGAASQAPLCTAGVGGPAPGASTAKTACVEFNSRGYPVNSANTIVANDAIYITNSSTLYSAIAISISGQPSTYRYTGSGWAQF